MKPSSRVRLSLSLSEKALTRRTKKLIHQLLYELESAEDISVSYFGFIDNMEPRTRPLYNLIGFYAL